ncbi:unnamed protein product [Didymodactylos carnosus]|uniref:Uncharacterized protein n=1 Tax=Didymodactylos carnosus TaxID=1234261 RepID=A0A815DBE8_9BILA|nr:unnamed protein product [Didymodactylos carnosus]CAF1295696.1 unnamed protein product [Didymodactylos carnosus]CAF3496871.1 unnamed protein product [Didymodactylos carnosus]CAF4109949.1 unnamed protein product [Didymodactylos carnosus]
MNLNSSYSNKTDNVVTGNTVYDEKGAVLYIVVVIIWYAIGFGLTLLDDIKPQPGREKPHKSVSVYRTMDDIHEEQNRNDILNELKDTKRREKLWQIYFGNRTYSENHKYSFKKADELAVESITKQLSDLKEKRETLKNTLHEAEEQPDTPPTVARRPPTVVETDEDEEDDNVLSCFTSSVL